MDRAGERTKTRDTEELLAEIKGRGDAPGREERQSSARETDTQRARLRERASSAFSLRAFFLALVLIAVGVALGGFVPILGVVLRYAGVFSAAFVFGLVSNRRHYVEAGLAGALVPGIGTLLDYFALTIAGVGLPVIAIAAGLGLLCGVIGHYFGRDLRDGLTREL